MNYFTKNVINSAIAPYFVDVRPSNLLKFFAQIKGIRQEIGRGSNGLFHESTTEILILFDDVPGTSHHTCITRPVVLGAKAGSLLI